LKTSFAGPVLEITKKTKFFLQNQKLAKMFIPNRRLLVLVGNINPALILAFLFPVKTGEISSA